MLPAGRGDLRPIHDMVAQIARDQGIGHRWPDHPRPWVVATDIREGRRVTFGRERSAALADAVVASCAIPAWYAPVEIGDRSYVDGGTMSNASVDLLVGEGYDEVYVVAPMASTGPLPRPWSPVARAEREMRASITRTIRRDVARLADAGSRVVLVCPGEAELAVIGINMMNPTRRTDVLDAAVVATRAQIRAQLAVAPVDGEQTPPKATGTGGVS